MLDNKLIENALALCGKIMEDMTEPEFVHRTQGFPELYHGRLNWLFSIDKFCYYLLSPEFIKKYSKLAYGWSDLADINKSRKAYGLAIGKYQSGNEKPLIKLLSKINGK